MPEDFWPLNTTLYVRDFKGNNPRFIAYFLRSLDFSAYSDKAAVPGLNRNHLHEASVRVPPVPEQRAIADVLGTLDDKIELNRRMNQTLEEMARALFKSWFVDFDPVHAKAALRKHAVRASEPEYARLHPHPSPPPSRGRGSENSGRGSDNSPLEGESARRGALAPSSRWGEAQRTDSTWKDIQRSYSKKTLEQAKALRQRQTDAEGLLWHYLRKKQLGGFKFRRQQPIGPYIVDFACMPEKLLVELDGGQHAERAAHDQRRDAFLRSKGYRVLRFWNNEVFENCYGVLERVYEALRNPPPRQPEPAGSIAATPPQGGSDGTPSTVTGSTPSPFSSSPSPLEGEGWGGGDPMKQEGEGAPMRSEGGGTPAPTANWTVERARAYLDAMDPQIADLFPDRLVDSELGEIPEGWEVAAAGKVMTVHGGSTPSTKEPSYWGGEHCFATPKDLSTLQEPILASTARRLTDAGIGRIGSGLLPPGTVLLSSRAPIGYLAVTETNGHCRQPGHHCDGVRRSLRRVLRSAMDTVSYVRHQRSSQRHHIR